MKEKCIISKLNLIKEEISKAFSEEGAIEVGINMGDVFEDIEKGIKEKDYRIQKEMDNNKILNDKLIESEKYFENIYNNMETIIFVLEIDKKEEFRYTGVNPAFENRIGIQESEIIGKKDSDIFPRELAHIFMKNNESCLKTKKTVDYEQKIVIKGRDTWWHIRLIPVINRDGNVNKIIGTAYDITPIKSAENEAKANEKFISTLIETIPNPVFYKDKEMRYRRCNGAFEKMINNTRENIYGKKCEDIFQKDIRDITENNDNEIVKKNKRIKYEIKIKLNDGENRNYLVNKAPYFDIDGNFNGIVGVISDITELKKMQETLKELSVNDELTGVYNKRGIREMGSKGFKEAQRAGNFITVIMIDIDYFKKYNDCYGHQAGDRCLIAVADTIKESCKRPFDIVGRYGGEEFIVILSDTDLEGSALVAERIRKNIYNLKIKHEESMIDNYISVSAGFYCGVPNEGDTMEVFIEKADEKLYNAKKYGRNRVEN